MLALLVFDLDSNACASAAMHTFSLPTELKTGLESVSSHQMHQWLLLWKTDTSHLMHVKHLSPKARVITGSHTTTERVQLTGPTALTRSQARLTNMLT